MKHKPANWRSRQDNAQKALPAAFRRYVRRHNRMVATAVLFSIGGTLILWPLLYGFSMWFTLFFLTLIQGVDAELPPKFAQHFAVAAVAIGPSLLLADRTLRTSFAGFSARNPGIRWFLELLAVPYKIPLAIISNSQAFVWPTRTEMTLAVELLRRLDDMDYLETRRLDLEMPNPRRRQAVLQLLALVDLIHYQMRDGRMYLLLRDPEKVRSLIYSEVRFAKEPAPRGKTQRDRETRKNREKMLRPPSLDRFRNSTNTRKYP